MTTIKKAVGFSSMMDIDKLKLSGIRWFSIDSFSSMMDIDKLKR